MGLGPLVWQEIFECVIGIDVWHLIGQQLIEKNNGWFGENNPLLEACVITKNVHFESSIAHFLQN